MTVYELNIDGLVGPSHHYGGLSKGNKASTSHAFQISNPRAAALQGLEKMYLLHCLGLQQAVLPPHSRPNLALLHQLGFIGTPIQQLNKVSKQAPALLQACYSASSMWAANAATVAPSSDTADQKVHFTAANLITNLHRQQESAFAHYLLGRLFSDSQYFKHHPPLPNSAACSDEGAANHSRLCQSHNKKGLHLFVYGREALTKSSHPGPQQYPARQTREASEAIARLHQLPEESLIFACQNPAAIDAGVFHNDVIAIANENLLLIHEEAFYQQAKVLNELKAKADFPLEIIQLSKEQITLEEAVSSYLFNSQLLSTPQGLILIAPQECNDNPKISACMDYLLNKKPGLIQAIHYLDLKQSMHNGGGPACLRLRIPLKKEELAAMHQPLLMTKSLYLQLTAWIEQYYRETLDVRDLADPQLMDESFQALDALTQILQLKALYPFQRA